MFGSDVSSESEAEESGDDYAASDSSSSASGSDEDLDASEDEDDKGDEEEDEGESVYGASDDGDEDGETLEDTVVRFALELARHKRALLRCRCTRQAFLFAEQEAEQADTLNDLLTFVKSDLGSQTAVLRKLRMAAVCFRAKFILEKTVLDDEMKEVRAAFERSAVQAYNGLENALNSVGGVRPRAFDEPHRDHVVGIFLDYLASKLPGVARSVIGNGEIVQALEQAGSGAIVDTCVAKLQDILNHAPRVVVRTFIGAICTRVDATVAAGRLNDDIVAALRERVKQESGSRYDSDGKVRLGRRLKNDPPEVGEAKVKVHTSKAVLIAHISQRDFERMKNDAILDAFRASDERIAAYLDKLNTADGVLVPYKLNSLKLVEAAKAPKMSLTCDIFSETSTATLPMDIWALTHKVCSELTYLTVGGDALNVSMKHNGKTVVRSGTVHNRANVNGKLVPCETKRTEYLRRLQRRFKTTVKKMLLDFNGHQGSARVVQFSLTKALKKKKKKTTASLLNKMKKAKT
jgi:hypothetical protein